MTRSDVTATRPRHVAACSQTAPEATESTSISEEQGKAIRKHLVEASSVLEEGIWSQMICSQFWTDLPPTSIKEPAAFARELGEGGLHA